MDVVPLEGVVVRHVVHGQARFCVRLSPACDDLVRTMDVRVDSNQQEPEEVPHQNHQPHVPFQNDRNSRLAKSAGNPLVESEETENKCIVLHDCQLNQRNIIVEEESDPKVYIYVESGIAEESAEYGQGSERIGGRNGHYTCTMAQRNGQRGCIHWGNNYLVEKTTDLSSCHKCGETDDDSVQRDINKNLINSERSKSLITQTAYSRCGSSRPLDSNQDETITTPGLLNTAKSLPLPDIVQVDWPEVKEPTSPLQVTGLLAAERIPKGTVIWEFSPGGATPVTTEGLYKCNIDTLQCVTDEGTADSESADHQGDIASKESRTNNEAIDRRSDLTPVLQTIQPSNASTVEEKKGIAQWEPCSAVERTGITAMYKNPEGPASIILLLYIVVSAYESPSLPNHYVILNNHLRFAKYRKCGNVCVKRSEAKVKHGYFKEEMVAIDQVVAKKDIAKGEEITRDFQMIDEMEGSDFSI